MKGFFAEEGLSVQGLRIEDRPAGQEDKAHDLWVKTDQGVTEADFGFIEMDALHNLAAGKIDYYIVEGMNFGCVEILVSPDSLLKSAADLKGKTIAMNSSRLSPDIWPRGMTFVSEELRAHGLDPAKDVTMAPFPAEALPNLNDFVAEGLKTGKFDAAMLAEPRVQTLKDQKRARSLFSQTYQAPYNQRYCCLLGIKRAIVDSQPDKAALIVRAYQRAKQWTAQNPVKAVVAAQAAGYYAATNPVQPAANAVVAFGYDREVDLAQMLERAFQERIDAGAIKTDKTAKELVRLHYRKIQ